MSMILSYTYVLLLVCVIFSKHACISSHLTTFRTESLNINGAGYDGDGKNIFDEALYLIKNHFLKRHLYSDNEWADMHNEFSEYDDKQVAVKHFLETFNDPYTRYISRENIIMRQQSIRGQSVGLGLGLSRGSYINEVGSVIMQFLPQFNRNRIQATSSSCSSSNITGNNCISSSSSSSSGSSNSITSKVPSNIGTSSSSIARKHSHHHHICKRISDVIWNKLPFYSSYSSSISSSSDTDSHSIVKIGNNERSVRHLQDLFTIGDKILFTSETTVPLLLACIYNKVKNKLLFTSHSFLPQSSIVAGASASLSLVLACKWLSPFLFPIEVTTVVDPSQKRNVLLGDRLLSVDGVNVMNWSIDDVKKLLDNGEVGEHVRIEVLRSSKSSGDRTIEEVELIKDNILNRKVTSTPLPIKQGSGVGYLSIAEFTDNTIKEVTSAMRSLRDDIAKLQNGSQMNALIIDLRGNPGGPLLSALELAALFLPHGKIVTLMSSQGKTESHKSLNRSSDRKTSLLLLSDESTASASEIFIAALQDHNRAKCMGSRTVGKNIAQAMMTLSDGSGVAFTVREYLSPFGKVMCDGITPDIEISGPIDIDHIRYSSESKLFALTDANSVIMYP